MTQQKTFPDTIVNWLLSQSEPWVVYNTRVDLLGESKDGPEVKAAYAALQEHRLVDGLLQELSVWPQERRLGRAYDPKDSLWTLSVLADFGLTRDDERIAALAEKVFDAQAPAPAPPGFLHGGFDHTKSWDRRPYICISHVMTYAMARFGYLDDRRLQDVYDYIMAWQRTDGGWHPNETTLPGNERQADPSCPFGTVNVLRAIAAAPHLHDTELARKSVDNVLTLWERRMEPYRPVGFGIGSTFMKLQYPFVQYQILKTIDTLANFPAALADERFANMLEAVMAKQTADGTFVPEAVNKPYADFDFGQKKRPSPWMTFLVVRAYQRLKQHQTA